jgi:hypothetical protein
VVGVTWWLVPDALFRGVSRLWTRPGCRSATTGVSRTAERQAPGTSNRREQAPHAGLFERFVFQTPAANTIGHFDRGGLDISEPRFDRYVAILSLLAAAGLKAFGPVRDAVFASAGPGNCF